MHRDERQHKPENNIMENNDNTNEGQDSGCNTASCYAEEIQAWEGIHSARYILEDISVEQMSNITGLPVGVVFKAFKNIFDCKTSFTTYYGKLKRR